MGSRETLFSLELAVESLRIHSSGILCRLPSVAFRLLDFPTLLLHHVDPEDVRNIKEKISLGSFGDIPAQLHELKDHRGNFCVNKCKSCLLKMDPETLLAYLRNTPLYIMLIDMWPEVPKLVANCTVSLQRTMEEISQDIHQNGIDIPSVHGHRDSYKLYNLMGSEVGWIVLRYRLLSMGTSLMPHIPDSAIAKGQKEWVVTPRKTTDDVVKEDAKKRSKEKDVILKDLEVEGHPKKTISIAVSTIDHDLGFRTEKAKQQGTQTMKTSKQTKPHKKLDLSIPLMHNDDLFVNNTHCPPPLFFNTVNEDSPMSSGVNLKLIGTDHRMVKDYVNTSIDDEPKVASNLSDELSTVSSGTRSEEVVHEIETYYSLPSQNQNVSPSWSVRKTHRTLKMEKSQVDEADRKHRQDQQAMKRDQATHQLQGSETCNRCQLQLDPRHQSQLPILAGLLQELSLLHGNVLQNEPAVSSRTPIQLQKPPQGDAVGHPQGDLVTPPRGKENIHISHPHVANRDKPYRHKHQECTKPPQGVPRTKGWLRQQPVHSKRKTKLHFGMTHSQKLRLRKNNPELLREMEMREAKMRTYQMEKEKLRTRDEDDFIDEVGKINISTEIVHHLEDEKEGGYSQMMKSVSEARRGKSSQKNAKDKRAKDIKPTNTEHADWRGDRNQTDSSQPPVPVPRKLTEGTFVWGDDALRVDTQLPDVEVLSEEPKDVSSSEKSARSLDVYLPSASLHESDGESHSDDSTRTDYSSSSYIHHPKTIHVPGLPSLDVNLEALSHTDEVSNVQYSDDFIGSNNFTSTGEQELEPLASNKSESYCSAQSSLSSRSEGSTKSQTSQVEVKNPPMSSMPLSHDKVTSLQKRRLSIPKPKLSSISPVPVRRTSKTSSMSVNTAATLDPLRDSERSPTPPTPKPRPSLMRSSSLFSEDSRLQSTVPSSEFKTEDSKIAEWRNRDESEDNYSDDFSDSDADGDHSDTF